MKTIALEQVDQQITEALKSQQRSDPILLTQGSDALGMLLPLPEGTKDSDVDLALWLDDPIRGGLVIIVETKHGQSRGSTVGRREPVFGSCQGMITVVSEDEEHLKDFEEYMK